MKGGRENGCSGWQTDPSSNLMQEALYGLTAPQKFLNPKWLYDQTGSALFEEVTKLPEYYLTRLETAILKENAHELAGLIPKGGVLAELGSGASVKTRLLLDAGSHLGAYVPIDISSEFLKEAIIRLQRDYPDLEITPIIGDFSKPLTFPRNIRATAKVGFFPGSTIGNIPPAVAQKLLVNAKKWGHLKAFIIGVDLVKDQQVLLNAYNDTQGLTARFIGNILHRLNREIGTDFKYDQFLYKPKWNNDKNHIEMALHSRCEQTVTLNKTKIRFCADETISVSYSRKYTLSGLKKLAQNVGWSVSDSLTDPQNYFAVAILKPDPQ